MDTPYYYIGYMSADRNSTAPRDTKTSFTSSFLDMVRSKCDLHIMKQKRDIGRILQGRNYMIQLFRNHKNNALVKAVMHKKTNERN